MRKILIVGSGQSGLQLALSLQHHDYDVTVMSARTPEEIFDGRVMSTQCMFGNALALEREYGLNFWEQEAPRARGLGISVLGGDGRRAVDWLGRLDAYAQSVDQRVKMATWLDTFANRGGNLVIHSVTVSDLDALVRLYDLVIVAAGKGELVELFDRDPRRSPHTTPQRALSVVYVNGMAPRAEHPDVAAVRCNLVPGIGELFVIPALTRSGPCDILFFEGVPGGPFDTFGDVRTPTEQLGHTLDLMREFVPWEYQRCRAVEVTDSGGMLNGRYTPIVRRPAGELPSGGSVLGMADVVVANDPITGQGSNNAAKCAASYLTSILEHDDKPFDRDFMHNAFDRYWSYCKHVTAWTNAMLAPPPPHMLRLLAAAGQAQPIADRFANGFDDPTDFEHWFLDPAKAEAYLATVAAAA